MKHITMIVIAFLLGLTIRRQSHRRTSRPIDILVPSYPTLKHHAEDGTDYQAHNEIWITFVREAIQPGLTELEARQIAEIILTHQPFMPNDLRPALARLTKSTGASQ